MTRNPELRAWFGKGEISAVLFAGLGGQSLGERNATGRGPDIAVNHWPVAIAAHAANFPTTTHYIENVKNVDPCRACAGRPVALLWLSPDCTHHSHAKGSKPRDQGIRALADVAIPWARAVRPRVVMLENVSEFLDWGPLDEDGEPIEERKGEEFARWVGELRALGYVVEWKKLRACDYGAPTSRTRLFVIARCDGKPIRWPTPTHGPLLLPYHTAGECIDWSIPLPSVFERTTPYSDPTLARIEAGWRRFAGPHLIHRGNGERPGQAPRIYSLDQPLRTVMAQGIKHGLVVPFVVKHFGARGNGANTVARVDMPLGTITAKDHHAIAACYLDGTGRRDNRAAVAALLGAKAVEAGVVDIGMRYLVPPELFRAQGFPADFVIDPIWNGKPITKTDQIKLCGNSVCPQWSDALITANFSEAA